MTLPRFTAEAGLERSGRRYTGQWLGAGGGPVEPAAPPFTGILPYNICERAPWLCFPSPQLTVSYQPRNDPMAAVSQGL